MLEADILTEDDRVELIRGEIIPMSPISPCHTGRVKRLNRLFFTRLGDRVVVSVQAPIEVDDTSEPQPDLAVLTFHDDCYASRHPKPEDILLVVEVANTPGDYDREIKMPLDAAANMQEVWLLDVTSQCLEVFQIPTPDGYQSVQQFYRGQQVSLLAFPEVVVSVDEVLG